MKMALIDTNIVSAFMRGNPQVIRKTEEYLERHDTLTISIITYYEILDTARDESPFKRE